jgi:hypothetical protein
MSSAEPDRERKGRHRGIDIEVTGAAEGKDLVDCLWRHGLPASLVERTGLWQVEVRSPREELPQLLGDLFAAVESWSPNRPASGLLRQVGEGRYALQRRTVVNPGGME